MQGDPNFYNLFDMDGYNPSSAMDDYYSNCVPPSSSSASPAGGRNGYPGSFNGVELQPSSTCPKNYIIFDQTENKSRVMFHPTLAEKHSYQDFDVSAIHSQYYGGHNLIYADDQGRPASTLKDDSDDIDALLSLEEEEGDNEEDDVISTGRTPGHYGGASPDSASSVGGQKPQKMGSSSQSSSSNAITGRKKERMKKMVKALKGIVPGGDQMDTPAVLDEAVRYLKSLKVEVQKLGIQNFKK